MIRVRWAAVTTAVCALLVGVALGASITLQIVMQ